MAAAMRCVQESVCLERPSAKYNVRLRNTSAIYICVCNKQNQEGGHEVIPFSSLLYGTYVGSFMYQHLTEVKNHSTDHISRSNCSQQF